MTGVFLVNFNYRQDVLSNIGFHNLKFEFYIVSVIITFFFFFWNINREIQNLCSFDITYFSRAQRGNFRAADEERTSSRWFI